MNIPRLIMLVGPPGSGKSKLSEEFNEFVRVSQDDQGKIGHYNLFLDSIKERKNIIVDRMNFSYEQRNKYLDLGRKNSYDTQIIVLHENYSECLRRIKLRENHPTIKDEKSANAALNTFFSRYERPKGDEVNEIKFIYPEGARIHAIWSDIDGTIANCEHRRHFVRPDVETPGFKKNWKEFFENMSKDTINYPVAKVLKGMIRQGYQIVFCSGRPENYRNLTIQWLLENDMSWRGSENFDINLFMRPKNDSRKDDITKEIILDFEVLTRYRILFCLDDRDSVVKMLRGRGMVVFQVADGDF